MAADSSSKTPHDLRTLCQQAGRQAAGWRATDGAHQPGPGTRGPAILRRRRWLKFGLPGVLGSIAAAVLATQFSSAKPAAALSPAADQPPAAAAVWPMQTPRALDASQPVQWRGAELVVDFDAMPLPQAIELLAQATRSGVTGAAHLRRPVAVTLHGRYTSVALAWQELLANHAAFSSSCSASRCQVWISNAVAAPADAAAPGAAQPAAGSARPPAVPQSDEEASQPGGSC